MCNDTVVRAPRGAAAAAAVQHLDASTLKDNANCSEVVIANTQPLAGLPLRRRTPQEHRSISDRYTVLKTLGEGAQGKVKLARDNQTKQHVALKLIPRNSPHIKLVKMEADFVASIPDHESVCRLIESFETEAYFVIVLEALSCDLFTILEHQGILSKANVQRVVRQMLEGLDHCHQNGIAHRDIKPENLLLDSVNIDEANAKICDFGLATGLGRQNDTVCGSEAYTAPEVLARHGYDATKADMWSAGIALYNFSTSFAPWSAAVHTDRVFDRFVRVRADFWTWSVKHSPAVVTPEFVSLFNGMCHMDPAKRLTAKQALAHPFFATSQ